MIVLNMDSSVPLYLQIYQQIKQDIISGEISEGRKLPSTRALATTLNVSRNTVESAYLQLCSEGYIESKAGSGFTALKLDNTIISRVKREDSEDITEQKKIVPEIAYNVTYKYDFRYATLSVPDFPLKIWRKVSNKCLASLTAENMTSYGDRKGELELRTEIMKYLQRSRGVSCSPEQIIVATGSEYCLSLLCQLFRQDINRIAIEDPGYIGAKEIFINNGYEVVPISLEKDGIDVAHLERSCAKMVYLTPSHQFPTGTVMPIQKRLRLLDWAATNNGVIIEDDYDSELRYNSKPIPSIQSIAPRANVVYLGTFSKALSPSLRINYLVLPQKWMEIYNKFFSRYQTTVSLIQQRIIQQFMYLGHWESYLRKICLANKIKHDILINTIQEIMGDKVIIHGKNAGLHILLEVNNGLSEEELIKKAKSFSVKVYPVSIFWMKMDKYSNNMVLLGFGGMYQKDIVEGVRVLNQAWFND